MVADGSAVHFSVIFIRPPEQCYFPDPAQQDRTSPEGIHPDIRPAGIPHPGAVAPRAIMGKDQMPANFLLT